LSSLFLVGIGLSPNDVTRAALDAIAGCNQVFLETYTSLIPGLDPSQLRGSFGGEVRSLDRGEVESGEAVIRSLSDGDVALLVPGDPMISTTHVSLRVMVSKAGHGSRIIHAPSILSAAMGESCLQATRFGRSATISFRPSTQPYDVLGHNLGRDLHTLFLLDIDSEASNYMSVRRALELLADAEENVGGGLLGPDSLAIGLARVSSPAQEVRADRVRDLMEFDFGGPPHSLIVPGKLHFAEEEALEVLLGKPSGIGRGD
jgi:diphthine synthase